MPRFLVGGLFGFFVSMSIVLVYSAVRGFVDDGAFENHGRDLSSRLARIVICCLVLTPAASLFGCGIGMGIGLFAAKELPHREAKSGEE